MNAKSMAICFALVLLIPMMFVISIPHLHYINELVPHDSSQQAIKKINFTNSFIADQEELHLNHEVIQYKIIFHQTDIINISAQLLLLEMPREPTACLMMITNGTESIFGNKTILSFSYLPEGTIIDMTFLKHRIILGGRLFHSLLNLTRFRMALGITWSKNIQVKNGDVWYLTMAELNSKSGEVLKAVFHSLNSLYSMEVTQIDRHSNMGYYSSLDSDFEGRYIGFKIPFLPFGVSVAINLHKELVTTKGGIINFISVGHRRGKIIIDAPDGKSYICTNKMIATFFYCGNRTGAWKFTSSGIGFPWKHVVILFFVDIDPHIRSPL